MAVAGSPLSNSRPFQLVAFHIRYMIMSRRRTAIKVLFLSLEQCDDFTSFAIEIPSPFATRDALSAMEFHYDRLEGG